MKQGEGRLVRGDGADSSYDGAECTRVYIGTHAITHSNSLPKSANKYPKNPYDPAP